MRTFILTVLVLIVGLFVGFVRTELVGIVGFLLLDSDRAFEDSIGQILWRVGFVCTGVSLIVGMLVRRRSR